MRKHRLSPLDSMVTLIATTTSLTAQAARKRQIQLGALIALAMTIIWLTAGHGGIPASAQEPEGNGGPGAEVASGQEEGANANGVIPPETPETTTPSQPTEGNGLVPPPDEPEVVPTEPEGDLEGNGLAPEGDQGTDGDTPAGPVPVGGLWQMFQFGAVGTFADGCLDGGCAPPGAGAQHTSDPLWTFSVPLDRRGRLEVTDAFVKGDRFEVFDNNVSLGLTSVPATSGSCGDNPLTCFNDPQTSSRTYDLPPGNHSVTIRVAANAPGTSGGAAYFRVRVVDACTPGGNLWCEFSFTSVGVNARGCQPADPAGGSCVGPGAGSLFAPAPPWNFNAPQPVILTVTDAFNNGDRFQVFDSGVSVGITPAVAASGNCGTDPEPCALDMASSTGYFRLPAGNHSIIIRPTASPFGGGAAYFRVDPAGDPCTVGGPLWCEFSFTAVSTLARGCRPPDPFGLGCVPGANSKFAGPPPWTFNAAQPVDLKVTDAFLRGDRFEVFDNNTSLGLTSAPATSGSCGNDPDPCFADPQTSSRVFRLAAGNHSITIRPVDTVGSGAAYFRVDPAAPINITSPYRTTPPTLDGFLGFGEWPGGANRVDFGHGFIAVTHDRVRLYVLIDVLQDTGNDAGVGDFFYLTFDVDGDGVIDPNVDLNYTLVPSTGNMRYQFYLGPNTWTGLQPDTRSARAKGFGCFFADGSLTFTGFPFGFQCSRHRVWELGIDLDEIGATPGGNTRMGVRVTSGNPSFTDNIPPNFTADFSNLIRVALAPPTDLIFAPSRGASPALEANAIELTQAIQDRQNTLPLVQDKDTVARVYANVDNTFFTQPAKVYLYGSQGGVDLPGSPLAQFDHIPVFNNRNQLTGTTNFSLPSTWPEGTVRFSSRVRTLFGAEAASAAFNKTFTKKEVPTYWVVPINSGSAASPVLASNTEIASQESVTETVYPVSDIRFVRKPWQVIGANISNNDVIDELNDYYATVVLAWLLGVLFGGGQPFDLPDQIYGFTSSGGGISDPTWYNSGLGRVSRGFRGTSRELTMAHEINHNLDRGFESSSGTWGRHVPNSCGAGGPDPNWPYTNDDIQEVGFDTRLPWVDGNVARDTVIPSNTPDYMGYCQSGQLPTKWVSPYRWQKQFSQAFDTVAALGLKGMTLEQIMGASQLVYYITGQVNVDGTGSLDPALTQPGIPSENVKPGRYSINVLDARGSILSSLPFDANFIDLEGERVDSVHFNFQIPVQDGAASIVLISEGNVLDRLTVSPNPPGVAVVQPRGGEEWDGVQTIVWEAGDPDRDELSFTILYSYPTRGETPAGARGTGYIPVANNVRGNSYEVDTSILPSGEGVMIRVIATDGVNTAHADSNPFTVLPHPPRVHIVEPEDGQEFIEGQPIRFVGEASDTEDEVIPDESFAWSINEKPVGTGRVMETTLDEGEYQVELTVADSEGNTGSDTVRIRVVPPAPPDIQVSPSAIEVTLLQGEEATERLNIGNTGDQPLEFEIEITDAGGPLDWISVDPTMGLVDPRTAQEVEVSLEAINLDPGTYQATIVINSNDPDEGENPVSVPVTLHVETVQEQVIVVPVPDSSSVLGGSEFDVHIQADDVTDLGGAQFTLLYDDALLSLVGDPQLGSDLDPDDCNIQFNTTVAGEVRIVIACIQGGYSGAPLILATVRFEAAQISQTATTTLTVQDEEAQDLVLSDSALPTPNEIPARGDSREVTLLAGVCGDLTLDNIVNVLDPITGLRGIVRVIVLTPQQVALGNVVLDQFFNIQDVILIMRHIVELAQITECGPLQPVDG